MRFGRSPAVGRRAKRDATYLFPDPKCDADRTAFFYKGISFVANNL
jgi:hypothetical protein